MEKDIPRISINDLNFNNDVPVPVPGCFFMEMTPNIDTKSHCAALDNEYKRIHMPITNVMEIDVLADMKKLDEAKNEGWLRQTTQIDSVFYREKSERNEQLIRDNEKSNINEVIDYQKYLEDTFTQARQYLNDDIVEEYPLVPTAIQYSLLAGQHEKNTDFTLEKSNTTLFEKLVTDNASYNTTKQYIDDKLCIEIRGDVAFYSPVSCLYRLYENKK